MRPGRWPSLPPSHPPETFLVWVKDWGEAGGCVGGAGWRCFGFGKLWGDNGGVKQLGAGIFVDFVVEPFNGEFRRSLAKRNWTLIWRIGILHNA